MKTFKEIIYIIECLLLMMSVVVIPYIIWTRSTIDDTAKFWLCMCVAWMQAQLLKYHVDEKKDV